MKKIALIIACTLCLYRPAWAQDSSESLDINGVQRSYVLHVPPDAGPSPALVPVFHGAGGSGQQMSRVVNGEQVSGDMPLDVLAASNHMIVAYPDGIDKHWNDGRSTTQKFGDDVTFISQLIDHLTAQFGVNPKRIYATGLSNGGIFTYRLACDLSNKIAAIAPV